MADGQFQHERLRLSENSIRLVQIHGGSKKDSISLRITQYAIQKRPPYAAISYTWGSASNLRRVTVNGRSFHIHANLWHLLYHLRQRGESRFLWVDALCIDQQNLAERNFHVQLMGKIYEQAEFAIVWLGLPADDRREARAMEFVAEIATYRQARTGASFRDVYLSEMCRQRWTNLGGFCRCTYWTRTWIIQEFLQAQRIEVFCGTAKLDWELFEKLHTVLDEMEAVPDFIQTDLREIKSSVPSRLTARRLLAQASSLQELIHEFHDADCTEPRDKVYGMLGIAADCGEDLTTGKFHGPKPDYSKHIVEVYFDVVSYLRDSSPLRSVAALTILLLQKSLNVTKAAIFHYLSTLNSTTLPLKIAETTLVLQPDYASIIEDTIPTWTSTRDLKQKLEQFDWAKYVGYDIQRKASSNNRPVTPSQSLPPPPSQRHRRTSSSFNTIQRVRSPIPADMISNAVSAAENSSELLAQLYNYPTSDPTATTITRARNTAFHISPSYINTHAEDKRRLDNLSIPFQRARVIIEQSPHVNPLRIGFACTNTRKGDILLQFSGLDVALVGRRTGFSGGSGTGSGLAVVGRAVMVRHADLKANELGVHRACGEHDAEHRWISGCLGKSSSEGEEISSDDMLLSGELEGGLATDPLSLFELLRRE